MNTNTNSQASNFIFKCIIIINVCKYIPRELNRIETIGVASSYFDGPWKNFVSKPQTHPPPGGRGGGGLCTVCDLVANTINIDL